MSYLTPFLLLANPEDMLPYRSLILTDEPGIPDDTYVLEEWYCPNPLCSCNEVHLKVMAILQKKLAVEILLPLNPQQPIAPVLENDPQDFFPVYTAKLFRLLAEHLKGDPDYVQGLREHYRQLRTAATNPTHPSHQVVNHWAKNGRKLTAVMPKRKRHRSRK